MSKPKKGFEVRNRPDWLYNSLPFLYIAIGLTVVFGLGTSNLIGVFSGILLISTGGAVFTMRATHRQELAKLRAEFAENGRRKAERRDEEIDHELDEGERRQSDRRKIERRQSTTVSNNETGEC